MKHLLLDYCRRKAWLLALGAVIQFGLGWAAAFFATRQSENPSAWLPLQLGVFLGVLPLSLDLQKGTARVISLLPLGAREIGRAWWLAAVGLPALLFVIMLFGGATTRFVTQPGTAWPGAELVKTAICLFLWMSASFAIVLHIPREGARNWRGNALGIVAGTLWGLLLGGGHFVFHDLDKHPLRLSLFIVIGVALGVFGWLRAGTALRPQPGHRVSFATPRTAPSTQAPIIQGLGGVRLLLWHTFVRAFGIGLVVICVLPVFELLKGRIQTWRHVVSAFSTLNFFPFWFAMLITLAPMLLQVRFLRTLPLPPHRLAALLLAMVCLPLLALGGLSAAVAGLAAGPDEVLAVLRSYLITLAPATLAIVLVTWLGTGKAAYMLLILLMMTGQFLAVFLRLGGPGATTSPTVATLVSLGFVGLAFALTWLALIRGTRVYRIEPSPFGMGWNPGR